MDQTTLLMMGISVATNIIFIKFKIDRKRYSDALLDGIIFMALIMIFSKTVTGLSIATMASSIVSLYLFVSPPKEFFKIGRRKN